MKTEKMLVSIADAAQMLSISRSAIYRLLSSNRLISVHVGGRHLIPVAAVKAMAEGGAA